MENTLATKFSKPIRILDSFTLNFSRKALSFEFIFCFAVQHCDWNLQNKFCLLMAAEFLCRSVSLKVKLIFSKVQNKILPSICRYEWHKCPPYMFESHTYFIYLYICIYIYIYIYYIYAYINICIIYIHTHITIYIHILIYTYIYNIYIYIYIYIQIKDYNWSQSEHWQWLFRKRFAGFNLFLLLFSYFMLAKKIRVIYGLPCVLNMSSKIFNNASNEDLSHYYKKPALSKGKV